MTNTNNTRQPNLLVHESSPYLLQHAYNPVEWHPWSEQTLEKAKKLDKPLLISIGYSTCHWCHVMEEESFESDDVAALMNDNFICIKVDREERPDVDQLYMDAVQMMTGAGGWPLNCFALPDGTPFFGGTYFRKEEWMDMLRRISELRRSNPRELASYGSEVMEAFKQQDQQFLTGNTSVAKKDLDILEDKLLDVSDKTNGGQKGAPKFPLPSVLLTELEVAKLTGNQAIRQHFELTLMNMASGGIYDQIGGGFARYAVDANWKVPHFEKMLYDNAQLVSAYSNGYKLSQHSTFKNVVYETIGFLSEEFENKEGGYCSALDADSEGEEGKFYVWTAREMDEVLGHYSPLIKKYFGVKENGNWEGKRNILYRPENISAFAKKENLSRTELVSLLESARKKLLAHRNKRTSPQLDTKVIASWNALLLEGLIDAHTAFDDPTFLTKAKKLAQFLEQKHLTENGEVIRINKKENDVVPGFLDDYANMGNAFLRLYSVTLEEKYFDFAKTVAEQALNKFFDETSGLFYYSTLSGKELPQKKKEIHDNVMPSSNASMMRLLHNLGMLTHNSKYLDISAKALVSVLPGLSRSVVAYSAWSRLLLRAHFGSYVLAVTGPKAQQKINELHSYLIPNALVVGSAAESDIPVLQNRHSESRTRIFVCNERACLAPVTEIADALEEIQKKPEQ